MKILSLYYAIVPCIFMSYADASIGCGTEQLRTDISNNMDEAIDLITTFNQTLYGWCSPDDTFPCPVVDTSAAIANLTRARELLYWTIDNYTAYLEDTYVIDCDVQDSFCDCASMKDLCGYIIGSYGTTYATQWNNFLTLSTSSPSCPMVASNLRRYANDYYCWTLDLIDSLNFCPDRCLPCPDPAFQTYVSTNMNKAYEYMLYANQSITTYCAAPDSPIVKQLLNSTITALNLAMDLFNITAVNYTQYQGGSYVPPFCFAPPIVCDCDLLASQLASVFTFFGIYNEDWSQFISSSGKDMPCDLLASRLGGSANGLFCDAKALEQILTLCQVPCISSEVANTISGKMEQAMTLIDSVISVYPTPCTNGSSFCLGSNFTSVLSDLQEASDYFGQVWANYTELINDGGTNITCIPKRAECSCRVIGELLTELNSSYTKDYLPAWKIYSTAPTADCDDRAKNLRTLVAQYYCTAQDLYRDYSECQALCATDWCDYYNCSAQPCPCISSADNTTIINSMDLAMSLIEGVSAAYPNPCNQSDSFCSGANLTSIIADLEHASLLFAESYGNLTAVIGDGESSPSCSESQPDCNCRVIGPLLMSINGSYHEDFLPTEPECTCRVIESLFASLNSSYYEEYIPVWQNYSTSFDYCVEQAQYLRDLVGQYYCITKDLQADYSQCQVECETDWCAYYNCTVPPCPCVTAEFNETITTNMESAVSFIQEVMSTYPVPCLEGADFCSSSNFTSILDDLQQANNLFAETYANLTIFIGDGKVNLTCSSKQPECNCRLIGDLLETLNMSYYADFVPLWTVFANSTSNCKEQAEQIRSLVAQYYCITEDLSRDYQQCIIDCQTDWCEFYNCTVPPCPCVTRELNETVTTNMESAVSFIQDVILAYPVPCVDGADFCTSSNFTSILADLQQASGLFAETYANLTTLIGDGNSNIICSEQQPDCSCRVIGQLLDALNMSYYADFVPLWTVFANSTSNCKEQAEQIRSLVAQYYCITEDLTRDYQQCLIDCNTDWCEYYNCTAPPCVPCLTPEQNITISSNMDQAISFIEDVMISSPVPCLNETSFCSGTNITEILNYLEDAGILFAETYANYTAIIGDSQVISCTSKQPECSCRLIDGHLTSLNGSYYEEYLPVWQNYSTNSFQPNCEAAKYLRALVEQYYCITQDLYRDYAECLIDCNTDWCEYYNCTVPPCPCITPEQNATISGNMIDVMQLIDLVIAANPSPCLNGSTFCSGTNLDTIMTNLEDAGTLFAETYANLTAIIKDGEVITCLNKEPACSCRVIEGELMTLSSSYYSDYLPAWVAFSNSTTDCETQAKYIRDLVAQYYCITQDLLRDYEACLTLCDTDWCEYYNCTTPPCQYCITPVQNVTISGNMEEAISLIDSVMSANPSPCVDGVSFCSNVNLVSIRNSLQEASALFAQTFANYTSIINDGAVISPCVKEQPECSCRVINDQLGSLNGSYYEDYLPVWEGFSTALLSPACQDQAKYLRALVQRYYCIAEDLYRDYGVCQVECNRDWCQYYNCSSGPCPPPNPRPSRWVMILGAIADAAARRCRTCTCGY